MTKIATIVPVRNARTTLRHSLDSVLNQSILNNHSVELLLVLVYNGCTDNSKEVGRQFCIDSSLRQFNGSFEPIEINLSANVKGIVPALNRGLNEAIKWNAEYIARQDADDYWYPTKLEKQLDFFKKNPEVDVLGTQINLVEASEKKTLITSSNNPLINHAMRTAMLNGYNPIAHPSVMFKTEMLLKTGVYDNLFPMAEDYWLWMKAMKQDCKLSNLPDILVDYTSTHNPSYTPLSPQLACHTMKQILDVLKGK
jgi:glycosyltransferase involved in cell wall biosynthesis